MKEIDDKLQWYLTSQDELLPDERVIRETDLDFLADSLSELIPKDCWRKVSDDLPKVRYGETSRVLVADDNFINISVFHISTIRGVDVLKREYKFWKPID